MLHIALHFILPGLVAAIFYRKKWLLSWIILTSTIIVDLDHLMADPIYDPMRCSINFHPLHTYWAIGLYFLFLIPTKTRLIGIGLLVHMFLDWQDCFYKLTFNSLGF